MWVYRLICNINPVGTSMGVVALTPTICQRRSRSRIGCPKNKQIYVCWSCLPCNPSSNWTRVEILAYGNRLRSTHCREFHYLKLCRPAYFVRTAQLLPHPGHEYWHVLHTMSFNVMTPPTTVFFIRRVACREFIPRC